MDLYSCSATSLLNGIGICLLQEIGLDSVCVADQVPWKLHASIKPLQWVWVISIGQTRKQPLRSCDLPTGCLSRSETRPQLVTGELILQHWGLGCLLAGARCENLSPPTPTSGSEPQPPGRFSALGRPLGYLQHFVWCVFFFFEE